LGTTIGRFRIARLIGSGGMGRVYVGVHPSIGSRVAVKVLTPDAAAEPDLVERFFAEARAVNLIRHEAIIDMLDLATLPDGRPYILMEYLSGQSLAAVIEQRGPLPLGTVAQLIGEVLAALGAAHRKGIVHRDLKPDNIFVLASGRAKVLDFGIAKLDRALDSSRPPTRTDQVLGTPEYMAPEQVSAGAVDARADLYAIGVILFEAVTGQRPFRAKALYELFRQHVETAPPRPSALRPELPESYEAVILRALAKAPEDRFATAADLATALAAASRELPEDAFADIALPGTSLEMPVQRQVPETERDDPRAFAPTERDKVSARTEPAIDRRLASTRAERPAGTSSSKDRRVPATAARDGFSPARIAILGGLLVAGLVVWRVTTRRQAEATREPIVLGSAATPGATMPVAPVAPVAPIANDAAVASAASDAPSAGDASFVALSLPGLPVDAGARHHGGSPPDGPAPPKPYDPSTPFVIIRHPAGTSLDPFDPIAFIPTVRAVAKSTLAPDATLVYVSAAATASGAFDLAKSATYMFRSQSRWSTPMPCVMIIVNTEAFHVYAYGNVCPAQLLSTPHCTLPAMWARARGQGASSKPYQVLYDGSWKVLGDDTQISFDDRCDAPVAAAAGNDFDPYAYLATATKLARSSVPDADLVTIVASEVAPDGRVHLRPKALGVRYSFRSPSLSKPDADHPVGTQQECIIDVTVSAAGTSTYRSSRDVCDQPTIVPHCTFAQVWHGVPAADRSGVAHIIFQPSRTDSTAGYWAFTQGNLHVEVPDDCHK
jgi:serine/threonine protein kinase